MLWSVLALTSSACAPKPRDAVLGMAARPEVVTVVPFQLDSTSDDPTGYILVQAEVDGLRGTFLLDTGAPFMHLNGEYVQPGPDGGIDTVTHAKGPCVNPPRPSKLIRDLTDVLKTGCDVTVHTLHIGTLVQHLAVTDIGPPVPVFPTNALAITSDERFKNDFDARGHPVLGWLGSSALEGLETIIDYPHRRLILIRLDPSGRRLVEVPAYMPTTTVPLLPVIQISTWGVQVSLPGGDVEVDTLAIDTGSPVNMLMGDLLTRTKKGESLVIGGTRSLNRSR